MQTRLPNGQIVYQEDYSCIVEPQNGKGGIYVGNLEAAQNLKTLKKHGIRAILTAAKGIDLNHPKSQIPFYLQVPGEDRDGFDMTRYFVQGVNFIREALESTSIMVHCLAGVSRSVCLVLAYFIKCKGFSYDQAYSLVKLKRSIIHPNEGFIAQLRKYEMQVRSSGGSPSRYEVISSPSKRRYEYYYQKDQTQNNPQIYKNQQYFASPSKRATIQASYSPEYESPSKKSFQQLVNQAYQSPSKKMYISPLKKQTIETRQTRDISLYQPKGLQLRKLASYHQRVQYQPQIDMRHISPDRRRISDYHEPKGRSNSILEIRDGRQTENKKLGSNYDRLRHTSAIELSEQLDNKIAAIRQKYSEYTKNNLSISRRVSGRQSQPRVNNYLDQNQLGLTGNISMKKISSEYEGMGSKYTGREFGIANNFGRTSVGGGLGLRKLNSMRDGY